MIRASGARGPGFDSRTGPVLALGYTSWKSRYCSQVLIWGVSYGRDGSTLCTYIAGSDLHKHDSLIYYLDSCMAPHRPVGLVAWFSLRVREVPGSTPGQALRFSKIVHDEIWSSFLWTLSTRQRTGFGSITVRYHISEVLAFNWVIEGCLSLSRKLL